MSETFMVYLGATHTDGRKRSFRCECGCNVFTKPDPSQPLQYKCNACGATFIGARKAAYDAKWAKP